MGKGTAAMGKKSGKSNTVFCRRCGKKTFHTSKKKCSSCGYGDSTKMRSYSWNKKN
jgi:large subunit ribosomal protein L37e